MTPSDSRQARAGTDSGSATLSADELSRNALRYLAAGCVSGSRCPAPESLCRSVPGLIGGQQSALAQLGEQQIRDVLEGTGADRVKDVEPWTYPLLLAIVDVALARLLGNLTGSVLAVQAGGWFVFAFVTLVGYFYAAALWEETGGSPLPLVRPLVGG